MFLKALCSVQEDAAFREHCYLEKVSLNIRSRSSPKASHCLNQRTFLVPPHTTPQVKKKKRIHPTTPPPPSCALWSGCDVHMFPVGALGGVQESAWQRATMLWMFCNAVASLWDWTRWLSLTPPHSGSLHEPVTGSLLVLAWSLFARFQLLHTRSPL